MTDIAAMRRSAHLVLARAVCELFPDTRLGTGAVTEDGFRYDFDVPGGLSADDLASIEERMRQIIAEGEPFVRQEASRAEAAAAFAGQPYKLELLDGAADVATCTMGGFVDACDGDTVGSAAELDPDGIRLLGISGAYWRGDERQPMLQRLHGTAWPSRPELDDHMRNVEDARQRDHRTLGEQLDLFAFDPAVGRGLPLWLPKGMAVRDALEDWAKETEREWGYQRIATPHLTRAQLYERSSHLPYFRDDMYPPMQLDDDLYYLRPQNCPHHMAVFAARPHSYRELPLRYAEYGTVYRYEQSGELHGLFRVRGMTMNDAHIFCRIDQALDEFVAVMRLHAYYYDTLGIERYHMVLALRDPANTGKYHGDDAMWETAERITREAMDASGIPYVEEVGSAAHYGPKVDFVVRSATGREYAASTNQLDLYLPMRFDLSFTNERNEAERPAAIHRAPLGTHERFVGFLLEHYGGAFPPWLAPVQVSVAPVSDAVEGYARSVVDRLARLGYRAELPLSGGTVGAAVRDAETAKVPYILVVGPREQGSGTVSVRARGGRRLGEMEVGAFVDMLAAVVASKARTIPDDAPGT